MNKDITLYHEYMEAFQLSIFHI